MKLFDIVDADLDALRQVGRKAIAAAKEAGVPTYYRDSALDYVRDLPDGTKERMERRDGKLEVVGIVWLD